MYNIMVSYTLSRGVDYCPLGELSPGTWENLFFTEHGVYLLAWPIQLLVWKNSQRRSTIVFSSSYEPRVWDRGG